MFNINLSNNIIKEDSEYKDPLEFKISTADIINEEDENNLDVASNISKIIEKKRPEEKTKQEVKEEKEHHQTLVSCEKCIKFSLNLI